MPARSWKFALSLSFALPLSMAACGVDLTETQSDQEALSAQRHGADDPKGSACKVNSECPTGQECEHGFCKPHPNRGGQSVVGGDVSVDRHGADDPKGSACKVSSDCPTGQECERGFCKPHRR